MPVVFKFEQIVRGIFEEKCAVLDACSREPDTRLLVKRQPLGCCLIDQGLPRLLRRQDQPKMMRIDPLLRRWQFWRQMRHELMPCKSERDGVARLST